MPVDPLANRPRSVECRRWSPGRDDAWDRDAKAGVEDGRSRSPWGPFEPAPHNPILTHRDRVGHPIQSLGHADFVEAADGRWWAVALGTRHAPLAQHHNIGRETFLLPVRWTDDGWPVVGNAGTTEIVVDVGVEVLGDADSVSLGTGGDDGWLALRSPRPAVVDGDDVFVDGGAPLSDGRTAGVILRAQTADDMRLSASLISIPIGSAAGIGVVTDRRHHASAMVLGSGEAREVHFVVRVDDLISEKSTSLPGDAPVHLEIEARPGSYVLRADDVEIGSVSARLMSAEAAEWFVAAHLALVHVGDAQAHFQHIEIEALTPRPQAIVPPFLIT
ncbi:family 43 glycosylhydrolase [Microbacterium sp. ZKA21]|uniref:family 43 glycosylhydrolase n=1 Tax=Microbacterium sp. ZKA21 TaxID=3381694 RepID=UPI003D1C4C37